jgi:hypothetical protein
MFEIRSLTPNSVLLIAVILETSRVHCRSSRGDPRESELELGTQAPVRN